MDFLRHLFDLVGTKVFSITGAFPLAGSEWTKRKGPNPALNGGIKSLIGMVGGTGFEPVTSTV
jgi:hypothetical protein